MNTFNFAPKTKNTQTERITINVSFKIILKHIIIYLRIIEKSVIIYRKKQFFQAQVICLIPLIKIK
jgi:hypothetical protein